MVGEESIVRTISREIAVKLSSTTPMGISCIAPLPKIVVIKSAENSGTPMVAIHSSGRWEMIPTSRHTTLQKTLIVQYYPLLLKHSCPDKAFLYA